jgi:hypothetical protein
MRLFHFSSTPGIEVFVPRPPLAHPEAEPLVWAITEEFSPLYLFPRNCPRIGVWPDEGASLEDLAAFRAENSGRMRLAIDRRWEAEWRSATLWRYEFDPSDGFEDRHDHGCWVSRIPVHPLDCLQLTDLPSSLSDHGLAPIVADDLQEEAARWWRQQTQAWRTSLHVSMVRMRLLWGPKE